jgi:hypothetical protein
LAHSQNDAIDPKADVAREVYPQTGGRIARSSISGAIDGRPVPEYSAAKSAQ